MMQIEDTERTRCEVWSRVMGYFRPVSQWNEGKRSEWEDRLEYRIKEKADVAGMLLGSEERG